jgi:cytochrome d ubiquinol oxidase subunit I
MQHPVGYEIVGNRAVIAGFWDGFVQVLSNGFAWSQYLHVILGAWLLGGFFVMGVSAWHLLRGNEKDFFSRSFKLGSSFALVMVLALLVQGHHHGTMVAKDQPTKLAAMEGLWETSSSAPMYVLAWPDEANRRNSLEAIPIPGLLSFLAYGDFSATVKGLNELGPLDFAEFQARTGYDPEKAVVTMADGTSLVRPLTPDSAIPPVLISFLSFRLMLLLAGIFLILAVLAFINRDKIGERPLLARLLLWSIPLPYICLMAGWTLAEVGRQPWLVYKLMTTTQGISAVPASSVGLSLAVFITVYSLLGAINIYLLRKYAIKGPAV